MSVLLLFPFILLAQQQQHTMETVTLSKTTKVAPKAITMSTQRASAAEVDSVGAGLEGVAVTWMDNSVDASSIWVGVGRVSMTAGVGIVGICTTRLLMFTTRPWEIGSDVRTNTNVFWSSNSSAHFIEVWLKLSQAGRVLYESGVDITAMLLRRNGSGASPSTDSWQ